MEPNLGADGLDPNDKNKQPTQAKKKFKVSGQTFNPNLAPPPGQGQQSVPLQPPPVMATPYFAAGPTSAPQTEYLDSLHLPKMTPPIGGLPVGAPNPAMMKRLGMGAKGVPDNMMGPDPGLKGYQPEGLVGDSDESLDKVVDSIYNLRFPEKREDALMELGRKRESFKHLAPLMWHSFGTIAILLQELVNAYPFLSPPNLSPTMSSRVCSVLGLFQCLALHQDTRSFFLAAHLPLFLYPFLYTQSKQKPFENLRVSSLGVIGALVKGDDQNVINFLLQTEIIPLCLRIMKKGQELSKTVATFIVQKILNDKQGLIYICQTVERLYAVSLVLKNMTEELFKSGKDEQKLLRHIIRCYLRLLDYPTAEVHDHIAKEMPDVLKDPNHKLLQDESVAKLHQELQTKIAQMGSHM